MKKVSPARKDSFDFLFKEHYELLCLVSFAILKDKDKAKDVVQDFFISYWQKHNSLSLKVSFKAYAIKAVKNLSLLAVKKEVKEKSMIKDIPIPEFEVQKLLDKEKTQKKIFEILNQLPAKRREIFISSVLEGHTYSEIAHASGISINTVKTQIKRSYAFLRSHLKEDLFTFLGFMLLIFS
ncbi:RNA polymerase sigma factor [Muricauda sp. MAR_2010_75]|uniref:RNA polymerase sigma factor n=1 Tax=Allomuricauda sp. MAR_2010_75 TaxID=1250232 RepID=UPI0005615412|nr:sigma-70 family RNA polymerase sigma factor [Muricauda sp. MAR_2010_75]